MAELSGRTVNYGYDALYRLTLETIANDAAGNNGIISYVYDAVGNRLQRNSTVAAVPTTGLLYYDANDRMATDTYDPNGNTVSSADIQNAYDFENHLIQHGFVTIVYDGDGNRVAETVGGVTTNYLVDTQNPTGYAQVVEELESGSVARTYTWGLALISKLETGNSQLSFYGFDGHGSVRQLTDATGAVTDTYDYDAFGSLINQTGSTPNNYLFAGEQYDPALGLYYNRSRYLDVRVGRFWGMDTEEGNRQEPLSLHKYLFASGNPVNSVDPSGHDDLAELMSYTSTNYVIQSMSTLMLKGALYGAVFGATDALLQNKPGKEIFAAALKGGVLGAVLGPLTQVKFVAPVLIAWGTVGGFAGTVEAIEQKNWTLAAFRATAVYVGARTFVDEPVQSGGRLGGPDTRTQLRAYAEFLRNRGWKIMGGGGVEGEEYLPGSGTGTNGGNFVDLTAAKNGVTLRVNTITTRSDGMTPTSEEAAAAALIRSKIDPNDPFILIPKWSLPEWYGQR